MNIKDFSLNDALSNFNAGRIQNRNPRPFDRGIGKPTEKKGGVSETAKGDDARASTRGSVTRERIRQIEAKALRKLRHPSRSRQLKDFLDN